MAGRVRTRTWGESEVSRAVEALGGVQWAAAILGKTSETITQWLMAGSVTKEAAPAMARAALEKGVSLNLLKLLYGEEPQIGDGEGQHGNGRRPRKGVKMTATYHESRSLRSIGNSASGFQKAAGF